ncbi:MAG: SDR family NAD(P)-dependent oxidoreductase [Chloroflexi bacterium]|nr:MAG: SDR family NAD(P)-dependent oxidoreductase [Chloroflexota bacterium]
MAHAAVAQAMRSTRPEKGHILHLTQIVWMRPLVISKQPIEVHIDLELQENQKIIFTISSQNHETEDEALTIVSQGRAELHIGEEMAPSLDLTAIQTRCQHSSLSATECYQRYRELGISYGPTLQGIVYLNLGEGELLARLSLPAAVAQAHKEYPHWKIQLSDLTTDSTLPLADICRLPADPQGHGWLYRYGHWYRQMLVPVDASTFKMHEAYRRGGVYVVSGGAGGIGEVWSEYLIRKYQAQIIWIGRRKTDAGILLKQQRLAALGRIPHYITADAASLPELQQAYEQIKRTFGRVHGVVHSAVVLRDQSLAKMDEERFRAVLAAKVDVSVRLAQVFEQEPLDFVLFFSSVHAFLRATCRTK